MRTYTISTPFRLNILRPARAERKLQKGITAAMAFYHLSMKLSGAAPAATAPQLPPPIVPVHPMLDERTGLTHDYPQKRCGGTL